ncbi:MAG TPA: DUF2231 domain-containing protein [Coleofasciculaceae cyanobacterium]
MLGLPLNSVGLPYPDPLHPIVVHFVIAMVFFSFLCDLLGYLTHRHRLFEVSFWNLVVASVAIFVAIILGQFEAGLANVYKAAQPTLNLHTITGWSLSGILIAVTAWRLILRSRSLFQVPVLYLGTSTLLSVLVFFQMMLGSRLVWVYGLHVQPVVEAMQRGTGP